MQVNQDNLLKDLDQDKGLSSAADLVLRRTTDLTLHGTKQPVHAIVRSLAAMVATERHLWLKHLRIKEKNYFNILKNIFSLKPLSCVFFFFLAFCYHHRDSGQDV